jgi:hypothetical protein
LLRARRELPRQQVGKDYSDAMSYLTLEVEINHGKVTLKDPVELPEKANGLLTIFQSCPSEAAQLTPLQALEVLQQHMRLEAGKAAEWMGAVRDARR